MDVLNSRVDNEQEKLKSISAGGDAQLVSWTPEIPKTPSEGKHCIDRTVFGASHETSDVSAYLCTFTFSEIFSHNINENSLQKQLLNFSPTEGKRLDMLNLGFRGF